MTKIIKKCVPINFIDSSHIGRTLKIGGSGKLQPPHAVQFAEHVAVRLIGEHLYAALLYIRRRAKGMYKLIKSLTGYIRPVVFRA